MNAKVISLDGSTVISVGFARKDTSRSGLIFTYEPDEFKPSVLSKLQGNNLFLFELDDQTYKVSLIVALVDKPIKFAMAPL